MDSFAYFLGIFPKLSETFILNEILALEKVGIKPQLFAMNLPEEEISHPEAQRLAKTTTYLPEYVNSWGWKTFFCHLYFLIISPIKYLSTLAFVLKKGCARKLFLKFLPVAFLIRRQQIKHIHVHFALDQASLAVLLNILIDLPFSLTVHAHDLFIKQNLMAEKLAKANFIVTCTRFNKNFIASNYPQINPEKVHVIYHGLDFTQIDAVPNQPQVTPPLLFSVARLVEKKGLTFLLSAVSILHKKGRVFNLKIVGRGKILDTLKKQAEDLQINGFVEFSGAMEYQEVLRLYRKATLFILPCIETAAGDRDGIPNVLVEAMACGLPAISTEVSGIPELIENDRCGLLVSPKNVEALATAIEVLLDDEEKRKAFADEANTRVRTLFDSSDAAKKLSKLFKDERL